MEDEVCQVSAVSHLQGDGDAVQHEAVSPVVVPPAPLVLVATRFVQSTRLLADGEVGRVAGAVGCNTAGSISSSLEGHKYVGMSFSSVVKSDSTHSLWRRFPIHA